MAIYSILYIPITHGDPSMIQWLILCYMEKRARMIKQRLDRSWKTQKGYVKSAWCIALSLFNKETRLIVYPLDVWLALRFLIDNRILKCIDIKKIPINHLPHHGTQMVRYMNNLGSFLYTEKNDSNLNSVKSNYFFFIFPVKPLYDWRGTHTKKKVTY